MLKEFIDQPYLIIENNIVTNLVEWNGDTSQWTPPAGSIALVNATTAALVWSEAKPATKPPTYQLVEVMGAGSIGYTWDGSVLTTNEPMPTLPISATDQPNSNGTQTA